MYFEQPAASPGGLGGFFGLCLIFATSLHPNLQQVQRWYQWKLSTAVTVFMIIERRGMILTGACAQLSKAVMPEHSLQDMDVLGLHKLEHLEKECSCAEWQELAVILRAWHSSNLNLMQTYTTIFCAKDPKVLDSAELGCKHLLLSHAAFCVCLCWRQDMVLCGGFSGTDTSVESTGTSQNVVSQDCDHFLVIT